MLNTRHSSSNIELSNASLPALRDSSLAVNEDQTLNAARGSKRSYMGCMLEKVGNKLALASTMMGLGFGAMAEKAEGATILSSSVRPAHEALGAAQDDTVWLEGVFNGTTFRASGVLIRGIDSDWVITAAHNITGFAGTVNPGDLILGNGTSYLTDRGQTSTVSNMVISSSYSFSNQGSGADYALLELSTRISPEGLAFIIASQPQINSELLFSGFGNPISSTEGALVNTGSVMAFKSNYTTAQAFGYDSALYDSGRNDGGSLFGVASSRDSGGSVKQWNSLTGQYENVGMMVASSSSSTTFLNFYDAEISNILNTTVRPFSTPEPSVATMGAMGLLALLARRRRA